MGIIMSLPPDYDSFSELCCDQCHFKEFPSRYDYQLHNLAHKSEPTVSLVRLSEYSLEKLKYRSYRVNSGVAKRTKNHVSPLKISLKKQKGKITFQVINKQIKDDHVAEVGNENCGGGGGEGKKGQEILKARTESSANVEVNLGKKEVEGKNLLERFGANISITRKGSSLPVLQSRKEAENELDDNDNVNKEISGKLNHDKVLERLLTSGISIAKQNNTFSKSDSSNEDIKLPTIVNVFSTASSGDVENEAESSAENGKQHTKNSSLKKGGGGAPSLGPKSHVKEDVEIQPAANDSSEKENKVQKVHGGKGSDLEIFLLTKGPPEEATSGEVSRKISGSDSPREKDITEPGKKSTNDSSKSEETAVNGTEESLKNCKFANNGLQVAKKHVRVKNSNVSKKRAESDRKEAAKEAESAERQESKRPHYSSAGAFERIKRKLEKCVGLKSPSNTEGNEKDISTKLGISPPPDEQLQSDFTGLLPECGSPVSTHSESGFGSVEEPSRSSLEQDNCDVLITPTRESENCESTEFNSVNRDDEFRSESFAEGNNVSHFSPHQQDVTDSGSAETVPGSGEEQSDVAFPSLPNEDQSLSQQQQDPLSGSTPSSGESLNQNFLHNFLNESQPSQVSIQPEGSEYMSLERLGQVSGLEGHGQPNYDINAGDPSTPMEQLSQQVQRLPNPPQINVIPQHHMQPPQLHTGLPSLTTQQSNSFDTLGHIQPPMPPPLYQGYTMYNQNFSSQGPQPLPPRPPLLQQRPQIQPRSFQSIAAPRPRNRSYPMKRNAVRMAGPQDLPHKQRRIDPTAAGRNQSTSLSPAAKIPNRVNVTPTKKKIEASKVASMLASRGITVTPSPAAARQQPSSNRSQQRSNPVLNIGPGVSITPNSGRSSGNFAVPGPRRNNPIVNADVERPERCATVDLTLDDDPPLTNQSTRLSGVRFPCNQCTKVFSTSVALENHKASHRTAGALPFKCDKCSAQYPNASGLQQHKAVFHKAKQSAPELAIPIVDLNHPGARDQLAKCGVHGFLPLSQLQSNSLGYFGVPIIHLDSTKEKAISNLSNLGAANVLALGKMKTLSQPQIR